MQAPLKTNKRIFVSYSTRSAIGKKKSEEVVERINKYTDFVAERDTSKLKGGDDWKFVIDKMIEDCFALLVVVTEASAKSEWVIYEWSYALGLRKPVLPLIFEEGVKVHDKLGEHIQQISQFTSATEATWKELFDTLQKIHNETTMPLGVARAIGAAEDWHPDNRKHAIEFLRNFEDPAAFESLMTLCDSFLPDTVMRASITLGNKVKYFNKRFPIHRVFTAEDMIKKAIPGISQALYSLEDDLFFPSLNVLARLNNELVVAPLYTAFAILEDTDFNRAESIFKTILRISHESVTPVLKELSTKVKDDDTKLWGYGAIVRLSDLKDEDNLATVEAYCKNSRKDLTARKNVFNSLKSYDTISSCRTAINIAKYYAHKFEESNNESDVAFIRIALEILREIAVLNNIKDVIDLLTDTILKDSSVRVMHESTAILIGELKQALA